MAGHEWEDWFEREEFIGQISDMRVQNLQVEREVVQKRTFTRWMNLHLEKRDPPVKVHDLFRDIQDGHVLMALLEELSGCKLLHGFKKSSHRIFRLNNIAKVLSFLEERNVKLVSIDAADVADGNSSIVLGLIWNIILFFQIKELTGNIRSQFPSSSSLSSIPTSSDSDTSCCGTPSDERPSASTAMREQSKTIKKLLQWVQKRTRKYGVAVHDFGKSWTSGLAFLAVIKSIDPSLVDMRKALLRTARENLEDAFRIAHYSLGIPRLLEPEDVTINRPDEQSIITYVSQFLEHFPGIEEPEQPCELILRSVSMCRLNFRDGDSDHMRNGTQRSRVRERTYMFQRDCAQPPPKILISSVSEDRSAMSPPFRPAAARSWSSEDFLADSSHAEDISSSVAEEPKKPANEVLTNSTSNAPQLSYTHLPSGSSVPESGNTESVIGDSAISSPDSWLESEFGGTPETFCESRSDGSLCDSGTAWDVYRATPVEVTTLDEGSVPSIEDRAPDEQSITDSYIDEGIYSLSSLESTQERIQGHSEKKEAEVVKEAEKESHNQDMVLEQVPDHRRPDITKAVDSEKMEVFKSGLQKGEVPIEQEPSFERCDAEVLANSGVEDLLDTDQVKQSGVAERTYGDAKCLKKAVDLIGETRDHDEQIDGQTGSQNEKNNSEEVEVETECQTKEAEVVKEKENHNQDMVLEQVLDHSKADITKEVDSEQMDTSLLEKGEVPREQEPSSERCDAEVPANSGVDDLFETDETNQFQLGSNTKLPPSDNSEELVKQTSVEERTYGDAKCLKKAVNFTGEAQDQEGRISGPTENQNERNNSEEVEVETECQKTPSPSEESREKSGVLKARGEGFVETQDKASEGVLRDYLDPQENTHPTNQHRTSKTCLDPTIATNIPLISISSEPEEQNKEETCDPERPDQPTASEQIRDKESGHVIDADEHDMIRTSHAHTCGPDTIDNMEISETTQECESPGNTEKDLIAQTSSTDAKCQPVNTEQEMDSTDHPDGHQDKLGDTVFDNETLITQQNTLDLVNFKPNCVTAISCCEPGSLSRDIDLFYVDLDQHSHTDDLAGDPVEPMDLFYPDKEEPMFTDPPDTEMQSWPSVLSVSALQPAPASLTMPDDQPFSLLGEDLRNGVDSVQEKGKVITKTNQGTDKASESQELCFLPGEKMGGLWGGDVPAGGSDLSEAEQQSSGSAGESVEPVRRDTTSSSGPDESQIPPVLRHRKGACFTESMDNQPAVTAASRNADNGDSDFWWGESWQLYLLLLLWLLLYCFWLLPQIDLKTLPSLLLNLDH